jgi:DNA repair exonuclease SbcCD ATPase subunit
MPLTLLFFTQEERVKYMTEAKDYKQRIEELEQEMASGAADSKPRRKGLRERTTDEYSGDVARLQDELKQCNLKLRKYVQHSERLEKERANVMKVVSSCNAEDIAGNNLEEMVTSICDRLTSIEEECDALAHSEDKASQYLSELDSLREKYDDIEKQLQFYKETNNELSNSHADCQVDLKRAQNKISSLTNELKSLQESHTNAKGNMSDLQSEQRRQMQWLEKENLQLGDELKRTKKELVQTKSQLDSVHKGSFGSDDQTEDLFGLSNVLEPSSSKRLPLGSITKPAADSEKRTTHRQPFSSVKKASEKKRQLPAQESIDKENTLNDTARSPFLSSAKKPRKSVNPFSSVKKAQRRITKALSDDSSPKHIQLGEENEHTSELTSDCKQS